jgi:hypothetical protein
MIKFLLGFAFLLAWVIKAFVFAKHFTRTRHCKIPPSRFPRVLESLILEYTYWNEESLIELLKKHCVFERNLFKFPSNLKMGSDLYILNTRTEYGWWLLENRDDQEHIRASGPTLKTMFSNGNQSKSSHSVLCVVKEYLKLELDHDRHLKNQKFFLFRKPILWWV